MEKNLPKPIFDQLGKKKFNKDVKLFIKYLTELDLFKVNIFEQFNLCICL